MKQTPTRKADAWGTLVSLPSGVKQQWYLSFMDGVKKKEQK